MDFSRLVLLSALLTHVSSSPIATSSAWRDGLLLPNPTGQPVWAAEPYPPLPPSQTGEPWTPTSTIIDVLNHDDPHSSQPHPTRTSINDDGAMKPIMGRGSLRGRSGQSVVTLSPGLPPPDGLSLIPLPQACTTTIARTSPRCQWDGTETIYPSTIILYTIVDCNGCGYVENEYYHCPNFHIIGTKQVSTASTYWSTVCSSSPIRAQETATVTPTSGPGIGQVLLPAPSPAITAAPRSTAALDARQDGFAAACPTTYVVQPEKSAGKTLTTYSRYTTTTVLLKCGGCPLVISTALVGYGPPAAFTKTTTLPVGTKTTYACQ